MNPSPAAKLSIVVICWNDAAVILPCLSSIFAETPSLSFEVIVSDNGSSDNSIELIRAQFPSVRICANRANLGYARGNNAGIHLARGEYVLILNPDTLIRDRALEKLIAFADARLAAGAFGCRVLNPDGSNQHPARPLPSLSGELLGALCLRWLGFLSSAFFADIYPGWDARTERSIGRQSGCCMMVRRSVLLQLGGFDERFFYHYEEADLCFRIWQAGYAIRFCPAAEITHLGGQSVGRFPIRFALETHRSRLRYFYKHFGRRGLNRVRWTSLLHLGVRYVGYTGIALLRSSEPLQNRLAMYRVMLAWLWRLDARRFITDGDEPDLGYEPLAPAPRMIDQPADARTHY